MARFRWPEGLPYAADGHVNAAGLPGQADLV
jgi:hypothetical protein